jgi:hypothetical protein
MVVEVLNLFLFWSMVWQITNKLFENMMRSRVDHSDPEMSDLALLLICLHACLHQPADEMRSIESHFLIHSTYRPTFFTHFEICVARIFIRQSSSAAAELCKAFKVWHLPTALRTWWLSLSFNVIVYCYRLSLLLLPIERYKTTIK